MTKTFKNFLLFSAFTLVMGGCGSELVDVQEFGAMAKNTRQLAMDVTTDVYGSCLRNQEYQAKYEARQQQLISKLPPGVNEPSPPNNKPPNEEFPRNGELARPPVRFKPPLGAQEPQNPSRPPVGFRPSLDNTRPVPQERQNPSRPPEVVIGENEVTINAETPPNKVPEVIIGPDGTQLILEESGTPETQPMPANETTPTDLIRKRIGSD